MPPKRTVTPHATVDHRTDAAKVVGHHKHRASAVLHRVFGFLELRGRRQAHGQAGHGGDSEEQAFHSGSPGFG
jgi:hypothetical protein